MNKILPYREIFAEELYIDLLKLFLDHDYRPSTSQITEKISSNRPQITEQISSSRPQVTERASSSKPQITEQVSSSRPQITQKIGSSRPQITQQIGSSRPQITQQINSSSIDSKIITSQHAELISKWVGGLKITDKTKFKLILRGSRDGFTPERFRKICDNISHTVSVIKVKGSNEILGGYNPIKWKSSAFRENYFQNTKDSFIFSFKSGSIKDFILSRVTNATHATNNFRSYGQSFGVFDLILYGDNSYDKSSCRVYNYEKKIRSSTDRFSVEEHEIFQIIG